MDEKSKEFGVSHLKNFINYLRYSGKENINTTNFMIPSACKNNQLSESWHNVILNENFNAYRSRSLNKKESEIVKSNSSPSKEDDQEILLFK